MNSDNNLSDFTLTYQIGNTPVFEKMGVIPQYLRFYSKNLKRTWRVNLKEDKQQGILKMNGLVAFNYFYNDLGCRMQRVVEGVVVEEWMIEEFVMEIRD
ncbi:hypothetical protein [Flavobacterium sp. 14A]|uniref:hypothetical protein n=1 Tax=Flavobacterium sp. 14A TaxID=2735896 RepID=UPI00156F6814|nr:hypothetical protein [Flavobacterium sp. 14A]NRT10466.1 hypothetical protein [Flavobacterium sp. 14A]